MDRQAALNELATAHAVALRLHDAGRPDADIARALDIPETSVPDLVKIAEAKVAAVLERVNRVGGGDS